MSDIKANTEVGNNIVKIGSAFTDSAFISGGPHTDIIFYAGNTTEMLRISNGGFYVRGVLVPLGDGEALTVYNALREWLCNRGGK